MTRARDLAIRLGVLGAGAVVLGCGDPLSGLQELDCVTGCDLPNAVATCDDDCAVDYCVSGFDDCNGDPEDGCEVDLSSDTAHCGACRNACDTCARGSCRELTTLAERPRSGAGSVVAASLVIDTSTVYFTNAYPVPMAALTTDLFAVAKSGGEPRLVTAAEPTLARLAIDSGLLYATALEGQANGDGTYSIDAHRLLRIDPESGDTLELARENGEPASAPVLDASDVFWASFQRDPGAEVPIAGGAVMRLPREGGAVQAIQRWSSPAAPLGIAAANGHVYWASVAFDEAGSHYEIARWSRVDGSIATLTTGRGSGCLLVDEQALYTVERRGREGAATSEVYRILLDGSETTLLFSNPASFSSCAADDRHIYAADSIAETITEIDKLTGSSSVIAGGQRLLGALATDGEFLYFATADEILRVRTP
jgi:hypothetical protein